MGFGKVEDVGGDCIVVIVVDCVVVDCVVIVVDWIVDVWIEVVDWVVGGMVVVDGLVEYKIREFTRCISDESKLIIIINYYKYYY